jgi:collagen type VI alpha
MFTCEYFFSDVPNVVVIVTDGESNIENTQTLPEARLLQNTGATLITVAVGFTGKRYLKSY